MNGEGRVSSEGWPRCGVCGRPISLHGGCDCPPEKGRTPSLRTPKFTRRASESTVALEDAEERFPSPNYGTCENHPHHVCLCTDEDRAKAAYWREAIERQPTRKESDHG